MSSPNTLRTLAISLLSLLATGCTTLPSFSGSNYVSPMDGAQVVDNSTRYTRHLECVRPILAKSQYGQTRFAVGRVSDFTGKEDLTNGKRITQGASLMVISALSRAGASLVERFDTSVADMELKYSDNKLITDNLVTQEYRRLMSGSLPGSDFHVVGGITEVNYNIRSGSFDSSIRFVGLGARYFVMNIAVDLRLVNTKTLEVVNNQSLQKQIIGTELSGGFFRIFSEGTVDLAASERTQEPIQRGVRMVLEQAVFNMLNETFGLNANSCLTAPATNTTNAATAASPAQQPNTRTSTIELTTPVTQPQQRQEKVLIDTATGEAYYPEDDRSAVSKPVSAQTTEATEQFSGLVSTNESKGVSLSEKTTAPLNSNNNKMKEKLLWGTRPVIR